MEKELESDSESEIFPTNPPKEAPPPLPHGFYNLPSEVFEPSKTDEETPTKPTSVICQTRRGTPPPVPPRASRGKAKLLSFKEIKSPAADFQQSDVRALLGKHTGQ